MDEIGTPWCVTVDYQSLQDGTVTMRDRDSTQQIRVRYSDIFEVVRAALCGADLSSYEVKSE